MKRIGAFFGVLSLILFVFLTTCGDDDDDPSTSSGQANDDDASPADDDNDDNDTSPNGDDADDDDNDNQVNPYLHPEQPGPFVVGNVSLFLTDESRNLSCGDGKRVLLTEVWYPANDAAAANFPENRVEDFFLGRIDEVLEAIGDQGEMNNLATGSYRGAPLHAAAEKLPVLIFSHGFFSNRFQNFTMATYLASHGYIVVAPDHICNSQVTLTPSKVVVASPLSVMTTLKERKGDMAFLLDTFAQNPPPMFAGHIDKTRFAVWGHSFGGVTAMEYVKLDPRVKAIMPIAAFAFPYPPVPASVTAPSLHLWGKQDKVMRMFRGWRDEIIAELPTPKIEMEFFNTGHFAFSDLCIMIPSFAGMNGCGTENRIGGDGTFTNPDHDQLHRVLNAYAVAFFGATLFGYGELIDYLGDNHFPGMMEYQTTAD